MKKWFRTMTAILTLSILAAFPAMAGQWQSDGQGWWWQDDDGTYPHDTWRWLDGNQDGVAECYYFDSNGYLVTAEPGSTRMVDGYRVNSDGVWIDDLGQAVKQDPAQPDAAQPADASAATDPVSLYRQAEAKNEALTSLDTTTQTRISTAMASEGLNISFDINTKQDLIVQDWNSSNVKFLLRTQTSLLGESMDMTAFYKDGYVYLDYMGTKAKTTASPEEFLSENTESPLLDAETDYSYLNTAQVRKEGEDTIISYTLDRASANEYLNDALSEAGSSSALNDSTYNLREARGELRINRDGYYTSDYVYISVDAADESGGTTSMVVETSVTYHNPGQGVTINFPSTDGYTEI